MTKEQELNLFCLVKRKFHLTLFGRKTRTSLLKVDAQCIAIVDTERDAVMRKRITRHCHFSKIDMRHCGNRKRTAQKGLIGIVLSDNNQIKFSCNVLRQCHRVRDLTFEVNTPVRSCASIRKGHCQSRRLAEERLKISIVAFFHNLKSLLVMRLLSIRFKLK